MRKPLVAGNWKMHGTQSQVESLITAIKQGAGTLKDVTVVVCPSFIHIPLVAQHLKKTSINWGGQNLNAMSSGAFTGEVSGPMLADYVCQYVIVGHSERRALYHEDLETVAAKFQAAIAAKLIPILCVGETLAERENGQTESVLSEQIDFVIEAAGIAAFQNAIIAYEPIWAIGTGLSATPAQAQTVHAFIRQLLANHDTNLANHISILYGGSVKADNAAGLFAMSDIDGALVGGASLDAKSFLDICRAAQEMRIGV